MKCPICYDKIKSKWGKKDGRQRYKCVNGHATFHPLSDSIDHSGPIDSKSVKKRLQEIKTTRKGKKVHRYVVTSAQNNTQIHHSFFESLLKYCEHNNAELLIIPVRYKNPTSPLSWKTSEVWWPSEVKSYLVDRNFDISRDFVVMGDVKINATAVDPVAGLETISGTKSAIFGHPQIRMKTVATPQDRRVKILHTTGSVSRKNYSKTKEGARGEHHHTFGAVVAEVEGSTTFIREIVADSNGCFYDLDKLYTPEGVIDGQTIEALVTGDEHVVHLSEKVVNATYVAPNSIVAVLQPKYIVRHDVFDFYAQNHHHRNDIFTKYMKNIHGQDDIREELRQTIDFIDKTTPEGTTNLIVQSNHNAAFTRWLREYRPHDDPRHMKLYAEMLLEICKYIEQNKEIPDAFTLYAESRLKSPTVFLDRRKSYLIKGIDVSQHGDLGINGARGTIRSYANTEYKSIIGHSHSPGIRYGCYQVGTSTRLQLDYNLGLSGWMNTHCVIYPNGKRALIHIVDGKWRSENS